MQLSFERKTICLIWFFLLYFKWFFKQEIYVCNLSVFVFGKNRMRKKKWSNEMKRNETIINSRPKPFDLFNWKYQNVMLKILILKMRTILTKEQFWPKLILKRFKAKSHIVKYSFMQDSIGLMLKQFDIQMYIQIYIHNVHSQCTRSHFDIKICLLSLFILIFDILELHCWSSFSFPFFIFIFFSLLILHLHLLFFASLYYWFIHFFKLPLSW